jgi:hypothetical protein
MAAKRVLIGSSHENEAAGYGYCSLQNFFLGLSIPVGEFAPITFSAK